MQKHIAHFFCLYRSGVCCTGIQVVFARIEAHQLRIGERSHAQKCSECSPRYRIERETNISSIIWLWDNKKSISINIASGYFFCITTLVVYQALFSDREQCYYSRLYQSRQPKQMQHLETFSIHKRIIHFINSTKQINENSIIRKQEVGKL